MKGTKTGQGLRINQVKYQIIKTVTDENSQCYSVSGKKVSCLLQFIMIFSTSELHFLAYIRSDLWLFVDNGWLWARAVW